MKRAAENFRRVGLIANTDKPACRGLLRKAITLITAAGREAFTDEATAQAFDLEVEVLGDSRALTRETDLGIVFGGDGTMLRVAREIVGSRTPIVGINVGGLGFLTDIQSHQLPTALQQIWAGETILEARPIIEATARLGGPKGQSIREPALNDFVVTRGSAPRLIELEVRVDDEELTRYRCDGLIVCSPTGSTAYSLAAGGAIVSPKADVFTLTPICPHTLSNRSVIISLDSAVQVKVLSQRVETVLTADGQTTIALAYGDTVTISRSRHALHLLHLAGSSFFDTLRRKLHWSGSNV